MPLFDTHIAIDWSARSRPSRVAPTSDAIWLAIVRDGSRPQTCYMRTRAGALEYLAALISAELEEGRRVLAGFDFPFGYPAGVAQHLTGQASARELWRWMANRIEDNPDNSNNRFEVAAAINRSFPGIGPFWGRPQQRAFPDIPIREKSRTCREWHPVERRIAESNVTSAKTLWQLAYTGAVGSQVLLGLPALVRLLEDPHIRGRGSVWPFDTGLCAPESCAMVLAEIYPSLVMRAVARKISKDDIPDRVQVLTCAATFSELDRRDKLTPLFHGRPGLNPGECRRIVEEEGWILGLGHETTMHEVRSIV